VGSIPSPGTIFSFFFSPLRIGTDARLQREPERAKRSTRPAARWSFSAHYVLQTMVSIG